MVSGSINCTFESDDLCGYIQDTEDKGDWIWSVGNTTTTSTGPSNDHTYNNLTGMNILIVFRQGVLFMLYL